MYKLLTQSILIGEEKALALRFALIVSPHVGRVKTPSNKAYTVSILTVMMVYAFLLMVKKYLIVGNVVGQCMVKAKF
jgi:hypothetical protein